MLISGMKKLEDRFYLLADADPDGGADPGGGGDVGAPDAGASVDPPEPGGGSTAPEAKTPAEPAKRLSVREELEKNFREANEASAKEAEEARDTRGRFRKPAGEADPDAAPDAEADADEAPEAAAAAPELAVPAGLPKEAAAEWAKVPPIVQAAVNKRLADSAKGVEALKKQYSDIDAAFAPHDDAITRNGHTRAAATAQLFGWFQALASDPKKAFPALVQSFGYRPEDIFGAAPAPAAAAATPDPATAEQATTPPVAQIPPEFTRMLEDLQRKVGTFEQTFAQQSEAQTRDTLTKWSTGKPYFEDVRQQMGQLIASGVVPLKDGQVDLDGAYEAAVWANPEVRAKVLADQQKATAAEAAKKEAERKKKQQAAAEAARRASVSVPGAAPGSATPAAAGAKRGTGKSIRDTILASIAEVNG